MTQVLRVPAGNLGFRLIRDSVEPADNDSAIDAIQKSLSASELPNT